MVICPVSELVDHGLDMNQELTEEQKDWAKKHTFYIPGIQEPYIGSIVDEWRGPYKEHPNIRKDDILYVDKCLTEDLKRLFGLDSDIETHTMFVSKELDTEDLNRLFGLDSDDREEDEPEDIIHKNIEDYK